MKKFLSLFVALAMVLSLFAGVGARSAKAATTYTLGSDSTGGTSTWDTTTTPYAGLSSVKLTQGSTAASTYVKFALDGTVKIPDLLTFGGSFWYKFAATTANQMGPQLELDFTAPTGTGHVEVTLMPLQNVTPADTSWHQLVVTSASTRAIFYGNGTGGGSINWDGATTYSLTTVEAAIITAYAGDSVPIATWKLTGARIELWEAGARTVNIDDINIAGTTYALESGVAHTLSSLAIAPATVTLAGGATQAFVATATYSDASTATVTATYTATLGTFAASTYTAPAATAANQTATITGSYTEGDVTKTATATVTISGTTSSSISGLHPVSTETGLPTYTFLDDPTVTGYYTSPDSTVPHGAVAASTTDGATVNVFQIGLNVFMFTFPLSSPIVAEGIKTITITDAGFPTVTAQIYVKYKVMVTANPAPALHVPSFIYGTVSNANGAAPAATLVLINGLPGTGTTVSTITVTAGAFTFSYDFPLRGDYHLALSNALHVPTYQTWSLGGNLVATTVLDPNPLYAMVSTTQESYLYVGYEDGTPVTGATIAQVSGVNTFPAVEIANGFYKFTGTTGATAGNNYYTITKGGLTIDYTLYFKPLDGTWNPVVKIVSGLTNYAPGGHLVFSVDYGVTANYQKNDWLTSITGPGKKPSGLNEFYVQYGGQVKLTLTANLWYDGIATDQTAKPVDVQQAFTLNPKILGDQVTISAVKANKGDTKDITVTVKKANGIERNNAKIELITTVAGMFSGPINADYVISNGGSTVTLDASGTINYNIVGGNYVFAGLTFNHKGLIEVRVTGTDVPSVPWVTADFQAINTSIYGVRVYPTMHTLTADITKFTAGVAYPVVTISGAVTGLSTWTLLDGLGYTTIELPSKSFADKGTGAYVFNFSTMPYMFGAATMYADNAATNGDDRYQIAFTTVMPTVTFTSAHKDGKLTDSFAEDVTLQVTDPQTGAAIVPSSAAFMTQHIASSEALGNGDALLDEMFDPGIASSKILTAGTYSYDVSTNTVKIAGLSATKGNQYVDYTKVDPTVRLSYVTNGVTLRFMGALKVAPPAITINKPADGTLVTGKKNTINVTALDAHGTPMVKAAVALAGQSSADFAGSYITTLTGNGGITNDKGIVEFYATPAYMGTHRLVLGAPIYASDLVTILAYSIVYRKDVLSVTAVADTTAPVITVAAGIDGSTVSSDVFVVKGTVADDTDTISYIYINGTQVNVVGGAFMYTVKLVAGENAITLQAADSVPNLATKIIKVTLTAAAAKTVIVLTVGADVVSVDGKATSIEAAPEIVNSRTFVPIRFIAETFGATVEWLPETQGITITLGDMTIGLQIGNATAVISGNIVSLPAAPYIKNGRTMVPLRVISESFGGDVAWDPATRTITISYMP